MQPKPLALLVEDDEAIRKQYKWYLEKLDFRVAQAVDGLEASTIMRHIAPELVVTDLVMPRKDGLELLDEIRAGKNKSVPVIVLSAHGHRLMDAHHHGASAVLEKPFKFPTFKETVETVMALVKK